MTPTTGPLTGNISQIEGCTNWVLVTDYAENTTRLQHGGNPEHSITFDFLALDSELELGPRLVAWHQEIKRRYGAGECSSERGANDAS